MKPHDPVLDCFRSAKGFRRMEFRVPVRTLANRPFDVRANPRDTVKNLKANIEILKGREIYPAEHTLLVHKGKFLKDDTTLEDNEISESSFIVIMSTKDRVSASGTSTSTTAPMNQGNPEQAANAPAQALQATQVAVSSSGPNANPMDFFHQVLPNTASNVGAGTQHNRFHNHPHVLRNMASNAGAGAQVNRFPNHPQAQLRLQRLLQENQFVSAIQHNPGEFIRFMSEGEESNIQSQSAAATPEDRAAIDQLEAMGFERELVKCVYFFCGKNAEQAANYLLDSARGTDE